MPSFTIFTPTYNRHLTLPRLYRSIRLQTLRDFEWLIIDDGSTDGTEALVRNWQAEPNDFKIHYFWQPNQHKKVAFNRGVSKAHGHWFVPIDSDDELLPDALEKLCNMWASISNCDRERFKCILALYLDDEGKIVGDRFPEDSLAASPAELYFDYKISGDKCSCLCTDALREHRFPEEIKNLVPEGIVWFRISKRYSQLCFNVPVGIVHRDVESITRPQDAQDARRRHAEGSLMYVSEVLDWVTWRRFLRSPFRVLFTALQYGRWAAYLPSERRHHRPQRPGARILAISMRPLGWCLFLLDQLCLTTRLKNALARCGLKI